MPVRATTRSIAVIAVLLLATLGLPAGPAQAVTAVFINEIHYDNTGTDAGEFIEVAGPAGTDLTGWDIVLYNGATGNGMSYDTDALSGTIPDQQGGFGTVIVSYPSNGIQNGSPDAVALVDASDTAIQFLSYEGTFTAVGGPANGMLSVDIGVSENGSEPLGQSLQLGGTGSTYEDFIWQSALDDTPGAVNQNQTFDGGGEDQAPSVSATVPASGAANVALDANISITLSEAVDVTSSWFDITCATSGIHTASSSGGPTIFTLDPDSDFVNSESCTVTVFAAQVTDQDTEDPPDNMVADHVWTFTTAGPSVEIHDIQQATHESALNDQAVAGVAGIVTGLRSNGFYFQDPTPDADDRTSEGIFVFTSSAPTVTVGDDVLVNGTVDEFRPGGATSTNLTITEIVSPSVTVVSSGNPLPAPTVIGIGGRIPPNMVIDDDGFASFDPASDGIDFYESLEHMYVQVNNPVAVGPTNSFNEIWVLADDGANAVVRTNRGGIVVRSGDFNPERIQLDDRLTGAGASPDVNVGDHFTAPVVGIVDYEFGNYDLLFTTAPTPVAGGLTRESLTDPAEGQLTVAGFNVLNLDPGDGAQFDELADEVVNNLKSPDLIALVEIQDNDGPTNSTIVDASVTYNMLIAAIQTAGGPTYEFRDIPPVDDQDGGEPGGNIRVGFLFRTDRGLFFMDRPGGDSDTPTTVTTGPGGEPQLSFSPGRIDPLNPAFDSSRKPLAAEFKFNGRTLFVVANHFNSKGGDQPLFGRFQPPTLVSEPQRIQQATIVNDFVDDILTIDSGASVIVLGDFNDFEFSTPMNTLEGAELTTLTETLPQEERYTYVFEGNSQALDHILVSGGLLPDLDVYDVVHLNAEFFDQTTDHDEPVARFTYVSVCEPALTGTEDADVITGTPGPDHICGMGGNDTLLGMGGDDIIEGGEGDDTLTGGAGDDTLDGGAGVDTASFADDPAAPGVDASLPRDDAIDADLGTDTFVENLDGTDTIENLTGGGFDDVLTGNAQANSLEGGGGNDTLNGRGGADQLAGGPGTDLLLGSEGDDTLDGGLGPDDLNGGAGEDEAWYGDRTAAVTVTVGSGANDGETMEGDNIRASTENVQGGSGADSLVGNGADNELRGGDGDDTLRGAGGADLLDGEGGTDLGSYAGATADLTVTLDGAANDGASGGAEGDNVITENVQGASGADSITGDAGDNTLLGKSGNDFLSGDLGSDVLNGGAGADTCTDPDGGTFISCTPV
jgi:uncharacterized protein